jgi:SpoVK/Ycf46/Vps4 family AAA+-type ATPase
MRKGRLDEIFFVDLPDESEREEIFRIHLALRKRDPEKFDLKKLASSSKDFSGAEIKEAVIAALYEAFSEDKELTTGHILETLLQTVPLSKTMDEQITGLRRWAEGRARNASIAKVLQEEMTHRRMEF